jgi:crotonobetainyl-CoA:carnitine CoA-transferase CaiB-like acyl-CoA transferase
VLPLDGFKVLDLTRFLSGPYCTMVLADMGADVVKVENFPEGDDSRRLDPKINGESYPAAMPNRNKRSLAVNLKEDRGRELFLRLAGKSDLVIENFRPGVTARLGIDYQAVRAVNPKIIYCSITGFGQTGPYRDRPGFDIIAQGVTGFMRMTGAPSGEPAKVGIAISDIAAGATAAQAILAAEIHRMKSGEGQYIDISLVDAGLAWTVWEAGAYFGSGELPEPMGSRHRRSAPYQSFRTSDGYVTIGANNQRLWRRLCTDVLERPEWLEDPRYAEGASRLANVDELARDIEEIVCRRPTGYWVERLDAAGVPGGPVLRYDETLRNEQVLAREMIVELEHPKIGPMRGLGIPAKMSETPFSIRSPAPWLGQHTSEILRASGFAEEEIADLYRSEIVYDRYRNENDGVEEARKHAG